MYQYIRAFIKLFANETEDVLRQQLTASQHDNKALRSQLSNRRMTHMLIALAFTVSVTFVVMVAHGLCHDV